MEFMGFTKLKGITKLRRNTLVGPHEPWSSVTTLSEHDGWVHTAEVSPDGNYLATTNKDGNVYIYSTSDWSLYKTFSSPTSLWVIGLSWSIDSTKVAFCEYNSTNSTADQKIFVLNLSDGSDATGNGQLATINARCREVAFSPDGKYLAVTAETGTFWVYKTHDWTLEESFSYQAEGVHWSPDGKYLAIAHSNISYNGTSRYIIFNVYTWTVYRAGSHTGADRGERVFFSPNSTMLAFADSDHDVYIHSVADGTQITGSPTGYSGYEKGAVRGLAWSDDGKWLAFCSKEGTATQAFIVDVEDGFTTEVAFDVGNYGAYGVHFSPNSEYFIVACQGGGNVRIYNV